MHVCLHEDACHYSFLIQELAWSEVVYLLRLGVSHRCRTGLFGGPIGCVYLWTGLIARKKKRGRTFTILRFASSSTCVQSG